MPWREAQRREAIGDSRYFQHDSRNHDPQLHIHNSVFNGQESDDEQWRTLDSRAIHRLKPAAGVIAERVMTERLLRDLGQHMVMRPDGKAREATAVTPEQRDTFSTRSHTINGRAAELLAEFEAMRGREATGLERDRIRRQATLSTRTAKSHQGETRREALERVDGMLKTEVAGSLAGIAHAARDQAHQAPDERPAPGRFVAAEVIESALEAVQAKKSSFTRADVYRELDPLLPDYVGLDVPELLALYDGLVDQAMARVERGDAAAPGEGLEPDGLRLRDGRSAYEAPGGRTYVTREHLRSENRLRAATEARDGVAVTAAQADAFVARLRGEGFELGPDQVAALSGVLTSGARLETLVGPAGTGKSFVVGSLARAWSDPAHLADGEAPRRVFGLATAQIAADVLRAEGLTASNTAAWLAAQRRMDSATATGRTALEADSAWRLHRGDVLVVDESSMADTAALAAIHAYAQEAGAKMLLVGDPRQLAAVGAGAMELVAGAGARYELADARRFRAEWERDASLRLRDGDTSVVGDYHRHGRLVDAGTLEQAEDGAGRAWLADTLDGQRSLLIVDSNEAAARVSGRLRDELVRLGHVEQAGVALRNGTFAGLGDIVQGRRLAWELAGYEGNRRGAVNREHYRVVGVRDDGALEVVALGAKDPFYPAVDGPASVEGGERLTLPPQYVTDDLTLAYAVTKHAAEGATVWSCYPVLTSHTDLNGAYVELSRATDYNVGYFATIAAPADAAQGGHAHAVHHDPRSILAGILDTREATDAANQSATAGQEQAVRWATSVQTAGERFADAAHLAALERTARHLDALVADGLLDPFDRARIAAEDGTPGLTRTLRGAEIAGHDPEAALRTAVTDSSLTGSRRVSDVIRSRIDDAHTSPPLDTTWAQWIPSDIEPRARAHLEAVAEVADTRTRQLGARVAAADPTDWALHALGPVPDAHTDPDARDTWASRAGAIAAHRELAGHTDPDASHANERAPSPAARGASGHVDAMTVLGSAPSHNRPEARAAYRAAQDAAALPEHRRDELDLTRAGHGARVRAWEREQAWGPANTDNLLAGTRQAQHNARQTATLRRAEADATDDDETRGRLGVEAGHADNLADLLSGQVDKLEEAAATRGRWLAHTAMTRTLGQESARFLADHPAPTDAGHSEVSADEWLDLDRAARCADDPHRDITDTDLDDRHHDADHARGVHAADVSASPGNEARSTPRDTAEPDRRDEERAASREPDDTQVGREEADHRSPGETDVPDVREQARDQPHGVDEDTVHVPDHDEVGTATARGRDAAAELRSRAEFDHARQEQDRAEQLARWHDDDRPDTASAHSADGAADGGDD